MDHDFIIDFAKDDIILEPCADCSPEESLRFLSEFVGVEVEVGKFPVEKELPIISFNCPNVIAFVYPKGEILILHPPLKKECLRLNLLTRFFREIAKRL